MAWIETNLDWLADSAPEGQISACAINLIRDLNRDERLAYK